MIEHLRRNEEEQIHNNIYINQQPQLLMEERNRQNIMQPAEEPLMEEQIHQGAENAVMNRQQQNARRKVANRQLRRLQREERRQEEARRQEEEARRQEEERRRQERLVQERKERAERITLEKQIVNGVTAEQVREHGCTSFQQIVTIEEAEEIVSKSKGFLYYKEVEEGWAEIKHTLPENIEIEQKNKNEKMIVPLRKTYNLFVRNLFRCLVDKKGKLKSNAVQVARDYLEAMRSYRGGRLDNTGTEAAVAFGFDNKTLEYIAYCNRKIEDDGYNFLPSEIVFNVQSAVERIAALGDLSEKGIKRKQRAIREKMLIENRGAALSEEQEEKIKAVRGLYEDARIAIEEMVKLRDLDIDGKEVAVPNACSANANFQSAYRTLAGINGEDEKGRISYRVRTHAMENVEKHIRYVINNIEWFARSFNYSQERKVQVIEEMVHFSEKYALYEKKKKQGERISEAEEKEIENIIDQVAKITITSQESPGKYVYHEAAVAGVLNKDNKNITYTIETFAAETKQYVVSPFTKNVAIGRYYGNRAENSEHTGVNAYYSKDNPLPNVEELRLSEMKVKLADGTY